MERKTSRRTVLCTAEAFGFGPAAALHQIAPHLRACGHLPGYIGNGWTLELQASGMYEGVQEADVRETTGRAQWLEALRETPAMLSVCDLDAAEYGVHVGAATVLYEVLAWFRKPAPAVYHKVRHLVCPDFFGVREALAEAKLHRAQVVPPLMPEPLNTATPRQGIVVNLGGLQTPHSNIATCARYAQRMVEAVRAEAGVPVVLTSHAVAQHLEGCDVRTVGPLEARALIAQAKITFLTGGIGNIMDAAGLRAPVCFLPPMSQSQGLQLALLRQHLPQVPALGWHEIANHPPIDYQAGHDTVMPAIAARIEAASAQDGAQRLRACVRTALDALEIAQAGHAMHDLFVKRFGRDDGRQAAAAIVSGLARGAQKARARA